MKIKRLIQISAGFNKGDAISNEIVAIDNYFKKLGIKTLIYSENIGYKSYPSLKKIKYYRSKPDDLIIYHHSIHFEGIHVIKNSKSKKILIYHNITPYSFFSKYDLKTAYLVKKGREDLIDFIKIFNYSYGDSSFNANELIHLGFSNVKKLPYIFDASKFIKIKKEQQKEKNILFVGRIAPNKKQTDLVKIVYLLKKYFLENFKLYLIGNCAPELIEYKNTIIQMIQLFKLENNIKIIGFIEDKDLVEYYSKADIFLSMSEHEGFCVPILEALSAEIPIIAYSAGAIQETLGNCGILIKEKNLFTVAYLIHKIFTDVNLKNKILETQKSYFKKYQNTNYLELLYNDIKNL